MKCLNCGYENNNESKFCMHCGAGLIENNNTETIVANEINTNNQNTKVEEQTIQGPVNSSTNTMLYNATNNFNTGVAFNNQPVQTNVISEDINSQPVQTNITSENINNTLGNNTTFNSNMPIYNSQNINSINNSIPNTNNQNTNQVNYNAIPNTNNSITNNKKIDYKKMLPIFIGAAVAVVIIAIVGFTVIRNLFGSTQGDLLDPNQPILVQKDSKYGYITSKGKKLIEAKYEYASPFYRGHAIVEAKVKKDGMEYSEYQVIDKKGKVKATSKISNSIKYLSEEDIWIIDDQLYNGKLKKISKDGITVKYEKNGILSWTDIKNKKAGIMTKKGKITYTYNLSSDETYFSINMSDKEEELTENYCRIVVENKKYAVVNCNTGKIIYDYTEDFILNEKNNIFSVSTRNTYSRLSKFYVKNDKIAYQVSDSNLDIAYEKGYIRISDNSKSYSEKYSYYDLASNKIVDKGQVNNNSSNIDLIKLEALIGLTQYTCDNGVGLKNKGKVVLECKWSSVDTLSPLVYEYLKKKGKNYVLAQKDSKTYLINLKNGKVVEEFNASYINNYTTSTFITYTDKETDKRVIFNLLTLKSIATDKSNSVSINSNFIKIKENDITNYYNTNLKMIYSAN